MVMSRKYRLIEASLLTKLDPKVLVKLIGKKEAESVYSNISSYKVENSDEESDESTTMDSGDDSDEYRRPTTIVQLV